MKVDELRRSGLPLTDVERQLTGERDALWSKLTAAMTELSAAHCTIAAGDALADALDNFYCANRALAFDEAQRVSVAVAVARLEDTLKAYKAARKGTGDE